MERESVTDHSQHSYEDDESHGEVGLVGLCLHVWVPCLIDLQHGQAGDDVHEGGVCTHITNHTAAIMGVSHILTTLQLQMWDHLQAALSSSLS